METRQPIPESLKRQVLVESGHRCAIPTCRTTVTEVAHIIPWSVCKEHKYENLIALCPNCHARSEKGEIDREALRMYKRILQRLTDRYERFELLVLNELRQKKPVTIAENMTLLIKNIVDDGFVETDVIDKRGFETNEPWQLHVLLTQKGKSFIEDWIKANKSLTY